MSPAGVSAPSRARPRSASVEGLVASSGAGSPIWLWPGQQRDRQAPEHAALARIPGGPARPPRSPPSSGRRRTSARARSCRPPALHLAAAVHRLAVESAPPLRSPPAPPRIPRRSAAPRRGWRAPGCARRRRRAGRSARSCGGRSPAPPPGPGGSPGWPGCCGSSSPSPRLPPPRPPPAPARSSSSACSNSSFSRAHHPFAHQPPGDRAAEDDVGADRAVAAADLQHLVEDPLEAGEVGDAEVGVGARSPNGDPQVPIAGSVGEPVRLADRLDPLVGP